MRPPAASGIAAAARVGSRWRAAWCAFALWLMLVLAPALARADADCPPAAQPLSAEQLKAGVADARDRGFLWRIRKDGHSSYLYGTVHVGRASWAIPGSTLMGALRSTDVIALELDLLDPKVMAQVQEGMAWRPERAVDEELARRLKRQLAAACLPEQLLTTLSPEMLANTLTVLAGRRDGLDPAYAIDLVMAGLGRRLGKRVASLETPQQQLALLQGRNREETRAIVTQALDELEHGQAAPMLRRIADIWAMGRLDELETYERWCDCVNTDEERALYHRMLDQRNPGLAEHIDALHRGGRRVFAAVGSLHMIGPQGLPALLARRGYRVERVPLH